MTTPSQPADGAPEGERLIEELDHEEAGLLASYDAIPTKAKVGVFVGVVLIVAILLAIYHDRGTGLKCTREP